MANVATAIAEFQNCLNSGVPTGIATIKGLLSMLSTSSATTVQELVHNLREATTEFKKIDCSTIAVRSASDLFTLFITQKEHSRLEREDFESCRKFMLTRGATFLARLEASHDKIVQVSQPFLTAAGKLMVHGNSRVVSSALVAACKSRDIEVLVTRSSGDIVKKLVAENVHVKVIDDLAVGVEMHGVDCVLLGAEGVVETGGIVNQLGSYSVALIAKALNKQTYVLAESFKFVREYPVCQEDLPQEYLYPPSKRGSENPGSPLVDYTPPSLLTLLFTDLGILTPSAVSDELINLYL